MTTLRTLAIGAVALVLSSVAAGAQDRSHYRDFQLGGSLASVTALSGASASEAKTIHQRPALMQDLEWRTAYYVNGSTERQTDPVQRVVFSFYNDQLSRLVVDYDRDRTEGMTDADMIEAVSAMYGSSSKRPARKIGALASQVEQESGTFVAWWGDADYSAGLYRSTYASGFRLIVTSHRLEARARAAEVQALRLDEREGPQREVARQKKEANDVRISLQKARLVNKSAFRP